jgi:hypothetical protein
VVARAYRSEPRRALDQVASDARDVHLRLMFDDPRDPDFTLHLWSNEDETQGPSASPAADIREARRWLERVETLLRRQPALQTSTTAPAPAVANPTKQPLKADEPDLEDIFEDDDPDDVPWKL